MNHLIALSCFYNFGPASLTKLSNALGGWQKLYEASQSALVKAGCPEEMSAKFIDWRSGFDFEKINQILSEENISTVCYGEDDYPFLLKETLRPPLILFYQGDLSVLDKPTLAVVGSRRYSSYGRQVATSLVKDLAKAGLVIVSGLALGIDSLSHQAALDCGGLTAAVPGSGLDKLSIHPKSNRRLAEAIVAAGGLLISEFPPLTQGFPPNFPRRNRVISGLSLGTLVIEAAEKSGSLITARWTLEQNREVMAVPGNIFSPQSMGVNKLIARGAKPITEAVDVINALGLNLAPPKQNEIAFNPEEQAIIKAINDGPKAVDELAILLNLDIRVITTTISILQINGHITDYGGGLFGAA